MREPEQCNSGVMLERYIRQIEFRFYRPHSKATGYAYLSKLARRLNRSLEAFLAKHVELGITKLPQDANATRTTLAKCMRIPRMSTFAIGAIINRTVAHMAPDTCFVNVGVWNGFSFLAGLAGNPHKQCIGIDNFSQFGGPKEDFLSRFNTSKSDCHHFFDMDYERYFASIHDGPIGFYIYDGHHSYDNQMTGLRVAEPFFADGCIVLVDDTNWEAPRSATLKFIEDSNSQYEILLDQSTGYARHPTFWNGLMMFRKAERY